jgi:hypothetical protein
MFEAARRVYALPLPLAWVIAAFPIVTAVVFETLIAMPATHAYAMRLQQEDRMVENFTAIAYGIAAVLAVVHAASAWRRGARVTAIGSAAAGFVCFGLGGEEVAWGERWLHFRIPDLILRHNVQGEFTVHNLGPLQDLNWWYPFILGVLGAAAIHWHTRRQRDEAGVPSLLMPWCIVLIVFSGYDNATDWFPVNLRIDTIVAELTETVEMLVSFAFAIGIALAMRRDHLRGVSARRSP